MAPIYRTSFIQYSADNTEVTQGTSWEANKISLPSLSKFHFNVQFLVSLRVRCLLKLEFSWLDFSVVGFPMSKCCMRADFISRKHFTSLLIIPHANTQRGNNHLGNLPNSLVTRRTCTLGNTKLGRQSVGVTTVFI